jgi:hypothetical protein
MTWTTGSLAQQSSKPARMEERLRRPRGTSLPDTRTERQCLLSLQQRLALSNAGGPIHSPFSEKHFMSATASCFVVDKKAAELGEPHTSTTRASCCCCFVSTSACSVRLAAAASGTAVDEPPKIHEPTLPTASHRKDMCCHLAADVLVATLRESILLFCVGFDQTDNGTTRQRPALEAMHTAPSHTLMSTNVLVFFLQTKSFHTIDKGIGVDVDRNTICRHSRTSTGSAAVCHLRFDGRHE